MTESAEQPSQPALRVMHFVTGGFSGATQVAVDLCMADTDTTSLLVLRHKKTPPTTAWQPCRPKE